MSENLQRAMLQIQKIMEKNDIGGAVILADGQGESEYRLHITEPSWSTLSWSKCKQGI